MTIKKRVFSIVILVFFIVFVCPLTLLPVYALDDVPIFQFNIGTPSISDNNGYIEILFFDNSTGEYFVRVYTWFTNAIGNSVNQTWCDISFNSTSVTLSPGYHIYDSSNIDGDTLGSRLNYFWCSSSGYSASGFINENYDSSNQTLVISPDNCTVKGVHFYGNFKLLASSTTRNEFKVIYSNDNTNFNKLVDILDCLYSLEDISSDSKSLLDDIVNSNNSIDDKLTNVLSVLGDIDTGISSVNSKLDSVISNTDDIEDKLDTIIEILESYNNKEPPTTVNKDSMDGLSDAEENLLNNASDNFNDNWNANVAVDLDTNANALIWNIVEGVGFSNGKVALLFFSILSISLIALLLAR